MDRVSIHSGLTDFRLVDRITRLTPTGIGGEKDPVTVPAYGALEAVAQLAAMHVRYLTDFTCHAFLMKIRRMTLPAGRSLSGKLMLEAGLRNRSRRAFAYDVRVRMTRDDPLAGEILIATMDYDDTFQQTYLETHYRNLFACLLNATE